MLRLNINAIYRTSEGEGIHLGLPQVFVRFQGCTIGCVNCDSKDTWDFDGSLKPLNEVLNLVDQAATSEFGKINRVSITGGDPFHPKHEAGVTQLIGELKSKGYFVNIEAAGTRLVNEIFDLVDFVSFDFKTPSTGVKTSPALLLKVAEQFAGKTQIKSVISDKKDFEFVFDAFKTLIAKNKNAIDIPWVLTPCYEPHEAFPKERFIQVLKMNEDFGAPFRVVGQQHKWIHGPKELNV